MMPNHFRKLDPYRACGRCKYQNMIRDDGQPNIFKMWEYVPAKIVCEKHSFTILRSETIGLGGSGSDIMKYVCDDWES